MEPPSSLYLPKNLVLVMVAVVVEMMNLNMILIQKKMIQVGHGTTKTPRPTLELLATCCSSRTSDYDSNCCDFDQRYPYCPHHRPVPVCQYSLFLFKYR
jgi:hypothetical protein